jgi:WD repeat-containing protein 19
MQCGDREIDAAIEVVGKSQNETLTHQLIDFLVGEKDGVPKDPNYIYRLYLALKKYDEAAKTALIIARQEQDLGNYVLAHSVVVETIRQLEDAGMKVSLQLRQTFVLLHSYVLMKRMVRRDDHESAARLLLRVTQSVSKFPMHIVQILTSTVVECQRAGLKAAAYEHASALMRPEYRPSIDVNLKRKIEAIVRRRPVLGEEPLELTSACPVSGQQIPVTQLECPTTRDALPMCVVTGQHMVLDNWCFCPVSKCPALYSEYVRYIEDELRIAAQSGANAALLDDGESKSASPISSKNATSPGGKSLSRAMSVPDPVLGKSVTIGDLVLVTPEEALKYIQRYNNVVEKKEEKKASTDAAEEGESGAGDRDSEGGGDNGENVAPSGSSKKGGGQKASKGKIDRARRHRLKKRN